MKNRIKEIDKLKTELNAIRPLNKENLLGLKEYYKIGLTYSSNALEGNSLTETETKIILEKGITIGGKTMTEHYEAIGHANAYDFIYTIIDNENITEEDIKNIHKLFYYHIDDANAGKYRDKKVFITGTDYIPPSPNKVNDLMSEAILKINDLKGKVHEVELATITHTELVNIHPFIDGNGRTARLLMNLELIKNGYPITIIPPVLRREYIDAVRHANYNDIQDFVDFISSMVYEAMRDYIRMMG